MTQEENNLLQKCLEKLDHVAEVLEAHTKSDTEMFFGSKDYEGIVTTLKVVKSRLLFLTSITSCFLSAVLLYFLKIMFVGA